VSEVVVHRCELRIRRTAGWAWGASPDALLAAATRAIPRLLATRLPSFAAASERAEAIHITQPVTVRIEATARQLAALSNASDTAPDVAQLRARIEAEVETAIVRAIEQAGGAVAATEHGSEPPVVEPDAGSDAVSLDAADAPRRALRTWLRNGTLAAVLHRLELHALQLLHDMVLGEQASSADVSAELAAVVAKAAAQLRSDRECAMRETISARVAIAATVIDALPATTATDLRAAIDRVVPLDEDTQPTAASRAEQAPPSARAVWYGELQIRSALPFLLLSSLRHAGWLDALSTLVMVHRVEADAFALAAGLAAKVLDPLERGWSRSPADRIAVAAFAGRTEAIHDAEIAAAAVRLQPVLAPLDAALRGVLARARGPMPLVLWRDERGWHLFDTDGMVAIAAVTELRAVLAAAFPALLLVPSRCADAATLEQIDYANTCFVTDAPPSRGETWRSFAGATRRLFTNDTSAAPAQLAAKTVHFDHWLALAEELAEVLADRPAIPRDPLAAFEATCALAATAALADIGGRLFPAEATTPVLALTRFRDLDARVSFEPDQIRVRVPLGRRHADLMRHGVLGTFSTVPWLTEVADARMSARARARPHVAPAASASSRVAQGDRVARLAGTHVAAGGCPRGRDHARSCQHVARSAR
jgi:hypothetical protein